MGVVMKNGFAFPLPLGSDMILGAKRDEEDGPDEVYRADRGVCEQDGRGARGMTSGRTGVAMQGEWSTRGRWRRILQWSALRSRPVPRRKRARTRA